MFDTPHRIFKKYNIDLKKSLENLKYITVGSLTNMRKRNLKKYEITVIGLLAKELNITMDDIFYMAYVKNEITKQMGKNNEN